MTNSASDFAESEAPESVSDLEAEEAGSSDIGSNSNRPPLADSIHEIGEEKDLEHESENKEVQEHPEQDAEPNVQPETEAEAKPDAPKYGLFQEAAPNINDDYDVVIVHGILQTQWTIESWRPDSGRKSSSRWISERMGLYWAWTLHFHYEIDTPRPDIQYLGGVEREAQKLLDGLVTMRQKCGEALTTNENPFEARPIVFIAHDIGGIIVKKALVLALSNPAAYRDIAFSTTCLFFFGCPHRGNRIDLQDSIARLLFLPDHSFQDYIPDSVNALTRAVQQVNAEFLDTKMLIKASVFNVFNQGIKPAARASTINVADGTGLPAPFRRSDCYLDIPYEFCRMSTIPHLDLVLGDAPSQDQDEKYVEIVAKKLHNFPYYVAFGSHSVSFQRTCLSLAPPLIPPRRDEFFWQPYDAESWIMEDTKYKAWKTQPGMSILHIKGQSSTRLISEAFYTRLLDDVFYGNVLFFAFRKHDARFNTLEALLTNLLSQLISRYQQTGTISVICEMMISQRAWTERDLLQVFESFHDSCTKEPMVFMIACLDECDRSIHSFLELLHTLGRVSEQPFKFVLTTTNSGADQLLDKMLSSWPGVDLKDFPKDDSTVWLTTFKTSYGTQIRRIIEKKPEYVHFKNELRDVLEKCQDDFRLGQMIVLWILNERQVTTRSGIRKALASLSNPTPAALMETIIASFGGRESQIRDLVTWVEFAFEPLTVNELAVAVKLDEGVNEETVQDVDPEAIREDILQFSRVFSFQEYEVELWYPMDTWRTFSPEEAAVKHGTIARLCILYLGLSSTREKIQDICDRYVSLDQAPFSRPKDDLISYAVLYWHKHYKLAGAQRPVSQATAFIENRDCRNLWSQALYVLSNPVTHIHKSYLSPLPILAMTGLEDLLAAQIDTQKLTKTFSVDADLSLVEAVRNGHGSIVRLLVDINPPSEETVRHALSAAAAVGHKDTLHFLITLAADMNDFQWPTVLFPRVAWLGFVDTVALLLASGAQIPEVGASFQNSALHFATEGRHSDVVKVLIDAKCDVNAVDQNNVTPLHLSACRGDADAVKMLIDAGANVMAKFGEGVTPIGAAVVGAKPLALKVLLEAFADMEHGIETVDGDLSQCLDWAAINGYTACVKLLIDNGVDLKAVLNKRLALWHAVSKGHFDICQLLLESGVDPNEAPEGYDPVLFAAVGSGLDSAEIIKLVKLLIKKGADVERLGGTDQARSNVLTRAVGTNKKDLVEFLLDHGVSPNLGEGSTRVAVYEACWSGYEDLVRLLIDRGASVHVPWDWGWAPLHSAYDNANIVKILLESGAHIDAKSHTGSVTYLAAKYNQINVIKVLLENDPKPNLEQVVVYKPDLNLRPYEDGMTPLCIACKQGNVDIVRLLLQHGANPDHRTEDGTFPLLCCLDTADTADSGLLVETLLQFRPNLSQVDNHGHTVLHSVKSSTPLGVVALLYAAGADIRAVDKDGETALTRAAADGNSEVSEFLISKSEDINAYHQQTGTVLHIFATQGNWKLFKAGVDAGGDVHLAHRQGYKQTLLHSALGVSYGPWDEGRRQIVQYLLEVAKVDPNQRCNNDYYGYSIIKCTDKCGVDDLQFLLDHGADATVQDVAGRQALHIAAFRNPDMVKILLSGGIEPLPRTKVGMTPLHFAATGMLHVSNFLELLDKALHEEVDVEHDGNKNKEMNDGSTTDSRKSNKSTGSQRRKTSSTDNNHEKNRESRVDIDDKDIDGWTPLMWAAKANRSLPNAISTLVERGADLWVTGKVLESRGHDVDWSPLKVAYYFGSFQEVYDVLIPKEKTRVLPNGRKQKWDDEQHHVSEADYKTGWTCDYCLSSVAGINYKCRDCEYNICYKCFRSKNLVHPDHDFEAAGPEFPEGEEPAAAERSSISDMPSDSEPEVEAEIESDEESERYEETEEINLSASEESEDSGAE